MAGEPIHHTPTWRDLRRPLFDTILNTVLLLCILISYIPQFHKIINRSSTFGIAFQSVFLNALFATSQLTIVLESSSYQFPILKYIGTGVLKGMDAFGAILELLQITVIWLCSITLLALVLVIPDSPSNDVMKASAGNYSPARQSHSCALTSPTMRKVYLAFFIIYTLIFLAPVIAICLPTPDELEMGRGLFLSFTSFYHIPAVTILAAAQFLVQFLLAWQLRHKLGSTSLSIRTLGLQTVVFILLGISSGIRVGKIGVGFTDAWVIRTLTDWYVMIGWRCVPYVVYGLGQAALFALLVYYRSKVAFVVPGNSENPTDATTEHSPLLPASTTV